jgi:G3E family GTPase
MSTSTPAVANLVNVDKDGRDLVPVTIVTGFLGSGKTTLLNHILANQQGIKTAVLVNEFGEIGIDNDLILATQEDTIELSNGCVCCSINKDLVAAVYKVLGRAEPVDYIIVETTGLANPAPVALTFLSTELRAITRVDSIVTLVDAANFTPELLALEAGMTQIGYSDVIVINKTDLVDEADVDLVEVRIRDIKPDARMLRSTNSVVPIQLILSVGLFETDKYLEAEKTPESHDHSDCEHDAGHCVHDEHHHHDEEHHHHHEHSHHLENDGFNSISFVSDRPFDSRKFQHFLDREMPNNVFRAKGFLWFKEQPEECQVFHLCGKRYTIDESTWQGKAQNKVVFIGQHLDEAKIRQYLEKCLSVPGTVGSKGFGKK